MSTRHPDGLESVPVRFRENGPTIGTALVTWKDGTWQATITVTDSALVDLGVAVTIETIADRQSLTEILVLKSADEEW